MISTKSIKGADIRNIYIDWPYIIVIYDKSTYIKNVYIKNIFSKYTYIKDIYIESSFNRVKNLIS